MSPHRLVFALCELSIQEKSPRRIGHLGDFDISQVANLFLGQVTNLC